MSEHQEQPALPNNNDDTVSPGLNLLSFFIPLIGAILYLLIRMNILLKLKVLAGLLQ